jgi:tripartite ATP-independent transporter DctP family solute receptor
VGSENKRRKTPMTNSFSRTLVLTLLVAGLVLVGCSRQDDVIVLKLAHVLDPSHSVHQGMEHMAERLDHYSGGTMRIDIYPSGQLGAERELVELVQIGSLAMTKVSAAPLEAFVPSMQVFSIPYVFRDRDHVFEVLDSEIGKELLDSLEVARLKGMGYYDSGSRSFYMVDTPVAAPDDIVGQKIRVMKSQTAVKMIAAMGGAATPIAWGELYTALQQGVVDGAENNPPSFYLSGHYEVSKYYALNEHTSVPDMLLMSEHIWDSLTEQQQDWLQNAVDDSVTHQRELWRISTEEALAAVQEAGVIVTYPDKQPFMASVEGMKASFDGTDIGRLIRAIEAVE